jgi:uncharacterized protein (TIGR03067 family)
MFRRVIFTALCVLLACGLTVQALQDSANDKDKKALQGKWELVSWVEDGRADKVKIPKMCVFSFDGGNLTCSPKVGDFAEWSFALDAGKTPKALDLKSDKFVGLVGIYELKADDLKLCFWYGEPDSKNRPKEFASVDGTTLMVLKRVKK